MEKILIASDLDSTLIHSKRSKNYDDYDICVWKRYTTNEQVSFISCENYKKLVKIMNAPNIDFLPITTRSAESYRNIIIFENQDALVANGGILLSKNSKSYFLKDIITLDASIALNYISKYLLENSVDFEYVDNCFIMIRANYNDLILENVISSKFQDIKIVKERTKTYYIPKTLTKGNALRKYVNNKNYKKIIACGDSEFDASMAEIADILYCRGSAIKGDNVINSEREDFTTKLLDTLLQYIE